MMIDATIAGSMLPPAPGLEDEMLFPVLFKKTSGGKIQMWQIGVTPLSGNKALIMVMHGLVDGKKQSSPETISEGKNAGRRNATTPFQQAFLEAQSAWVEKLERKHYGLTVEESAQKRAIAPMLAQSYDKHMKKVDWANAFTQPKLDGNRCHAVRNGKTIELITREGLTVETCPHIQDRLLSLMPDKQTWDGELYVHGTVVTSLNSLLRRAQEDSAKVEFHLYDVVLPLSFAERNIELLRHITKDQGPIKLVDTIRVVDAESLMSHQVEFIEAGFEGAMLRYGSAGYEAGKRSYSLLKVKNFADAEFKVIGCKKGRGKYEGLAIFQCETAVGNPFDVTAPGTLDSKRQYWTDREKYIGKMLTVKYAGYTQTERPVPFHPVAKAFR